MCFGFDETKLTKGKLYGKLLKYNFRERNRIFRRADNMVMQNLQIDFDSEILFQMSGVNDTNIPQYC